MYSLFFVYLVFLGFTNAFAFSGTLTISVLVSVVLSVLIGFLLLMGKVRSAKFQSVDVYWFLVMFLGFVSFSFYYPFSVVPEARVNYLASLFTVVLLFYYVPLFSLTQVGVRRCFEVALALGFLISVAIAYLEFFSQFFPFLSVEQYIYRPIASEYSSTALGFLNRVRGPVEESGHFALFVLLVGCLILALRKEVVSAFSVFIILCVLSALAISFSVAGILELLFALMSVTLLFFRSRMIAIFYRNVFKVGIGLVIVLIVFLGGYESVEGLVSNKLASSYSLNDRLYRLGNTFEFIQTFSLFDYLFGKGPGAAREYNIDLVLNAFVLLFVDYGFVLVLLLLLIFYDAWIRVRFIGSAVAQYFLYVALVVGVLHMMVIPNYWYPWFWAVLAFIRVLAKNETTSNRY